MTDQRAREQIQLGKVPAGYRQTPDGSLEFIPGGPADPNAAKRASLTETQAKATTFASRMMDAGRTIDKLTGKVDPNQVAQAGYRAEFPAWMPGGQMLGAAATAANNAFNPFVTDAAQEYRQAQENWVTANLRQESGAAIGKDEMDKDVRKWFPQPGDSPAVIAQKAQSRKVAERAMLVQAGPGAVHVQSIVSGQGQQAPGQSSSDPNDPLGLRR
jgi:hypothetical protein